jgi:predicted nucleic acid-binding protein
MKNIFIDTDVVIDFLVDRKPFSDFSEQIFSLGELNKLRIYISSLTFSNSYYILRKYAAHNKVVDKLKKIAAITRIIEVNGKCVNLALQSSFRDFEDALQYFSAMQLDNIDVIITRNVKDYKESELPIMTSETYLKLIKSKAST